VGEEVRCGDGRHPENAARESLNSRMVGHPSPTLVVEPAGRDAANTDHRRGQGSIRYVVTWGRSRCPRKK
jgi:hypothetical protein